MTTNFNFEVEHTKLQHRLEAAQRNIAQAELRQEALTARRVRRQSLWKLLHQGMVRVRDWMVMPQTPVPHPVEPTFPASEQTV